MKFQIRRSRSKKQGWYWRMVAENGKILAHSETYEHLGDANTAVQLVAESAQDAVVEVQE